MHAPNHTMRLFAVRTSFHVAGPAAIVSKRARFQRLTPSHQQGTEVLPVYGASPVNLCRYFKLVTRHPSQNPSCIIITCMACTKYNQCHPTKYCEEYGWFDTGPKRKILALSEKSSRNRPHRLRGSLNLPLVHTSGRQRSRLSEVLPPSARARPGP